MDGGGFWEGMGELALSHFQPYRSHLTRSNFLERLRKLLWMSNSRKFHKKATTCHFRPTLGLIRSFYVFSDRKFSWGFLKLKIWFKFIPCIRFILNHFLAQKLSFWNFLEFVRSCLSVIWEFLTFFYFNVFRSKSS